jgi:dTMP kinase
VPGFFIAVEGPEGAGKSTQLRRLAARLQREGAAPFVTKEPGGTPVGERVREVVLDPTLSMTPTTEFLLYSASRAQLVEAVLRPALAAGQLVLCDRFTGASVAYQGYGRGLPQETIRMFSAVVTGGLEPDLTLLFDLEPELGLARVAERGHKDRLEQADLSFHKRVRAGFLAQAARTPSWQVLDATLAEDALHERVWQTVRPQLASFLEAPGRSCDGDDRHLD